MFITLGSYGDVLPMLCIAKQLSQNGEKVFFLSNGYFEYLFTNNDIEFLRLSSSQEYESLINSVDVNRSYELGSALINYLLLDPLEPILEYLGKISSDGNIVLVANGTNIGARLYHDKTNCDFVSAYFAPCVLPSSHFFPRLFKYHLARFLPLTIKKGSLKLFSFFLNSLLLSKVNRLRSLSGLPKSENILDLFHSSQSIIGLYPQRFLGVTPSDWPSQFRAIAFPMFDDNLDISKSLESFLNRGSEPILVCRGTPNTRVEEFMKNASRAIRNLNERAILVSGNFINKLSSKDENIFYSNFLSYSRVIPRCKAVIHHGGIGTSAQCLRAGVPQLIAPWGVDQWDNSMRLRDLGVALELNTQKGLRLNLEHKLNQLLKNDQISRKSIEIAQFKDDYLGAERAAQYLIQFRHQRTSK